MGKADLHIHTTASDGQMSASTVVEEAANLGLSAIAITDHDTIAGFAEAHSASQDYSLEVLTGIEITTSMGPKECHLLAYGFNEKDQELNKLLALHQQARVKRAEWIIGELAKQGLDLDIDEVIAEAAGRNVGRPHIAEVLRRKGYISSIREAFIRYLSDEALGTIKSDYRELNEVIPIVKKAGGVAVIAHPGRLYDENELDQFVNAGIDGLETVHRSHNYEIQKSLEDFAEMHSLLCTGGSDFHGSKKRYYRHFGTLSVGLNEVKKIKALANRRKEISV